MAVLSSDPRFPRTSVVTVTCPCSPAFSVHGFAGIIATLHPHESATSRMMMAEAEAFVTVKLTTALLCPARAITCLCRASNTSAGAAVCAARAKEKPNHPKSSQAVRVTVKV